MGQYSQHSSLSKLIKRTYPYDLDDNMVHYLVDWTDCILDKKHHDERTATFPVPLNFLVLLLLKYKFFLALNHHNLSEYANLSV